MPTDNKETDSFGGRLCKLRKLKGLSQKEMADLLGYKHNASISNIEANKTPPDIETLTKFADILGADLHWLITGQTMDFKRALEVLTTQSNDFYRDTIEKHQAAKRLSAVLESKQCNGEPLSEDETKILAEYKKKEGVFLSRLIMLTGHQGLTRAALEGLLDNLNLEQKITQNK